MRSSAFLAALAAAGCAYQGTARDVDPSGLTRETGWTAIRSVPVILQEGREDCGHAVVAMLLAHGGENRGLSDVLAQCPPEAGRGLRAGPMRDYLRRLGYKAYLFHGEPKDLDRELSLGRPVIVGMVKPYLTGGMTHYEIVTGINVSQGAIATIDPVRGWQINRLEGFLREWEPAGRLTIVAWKDPEVKP